MWRRRNVRAPNVRHWRGISINMSHPEEDPLEGSSRAFLPPSSGKPSKSRKHENPTPRPIDVMALDPMFPSHLRKSPASLRDLSENKLVLMISRFIRYPDLFQRYYRGMRRYFHRHLLPELQTRLLDRLIPLNNKWRYPCTQAQEKLACKAHKECKLVYKQ